DGPDPAAIEPGDQPGEEEARREQRNDDAPVARIVAHARAQIDPRGERHHGRHDDDTHVRRARGVADEASPPAPRGGTEREGGGGEDERPDDDDASRNARAPIQVRSPSTTDTGDIVGTTRVSRKPPEANSSAYSASVRSRPRGVTTSISRS